MKIIAISDLHGNTQIIDFITDKLQESDLVILSGDITHFGNKDLAKKVMDKISGFNENILAIPGNCDNEDVIDYLEEQGINLHDKLVDKDQVSFCGIGGSLPCPTKTPFEVSEDFIEDQLSGIISSKENDHPLVMVTHHPPYNTLNDQLTTGEHVGSLSVRKIIEKFQPIACFSGHIHEGVGIDHIGKTKTINPGPLNAGRFAYLEILNKEITGAEIKYIV